MGLKSVTFRLDELEADGFDQFIEASGYVKERAIAAALRVFIYGPAELRELAHRSTGHSIAEWFRDREKAFVQQNSPIRESLIVRAEAGDRVASEELEKVIQAATHAQSPAQKPRPGARHPPVSNKPRPSKPTGTDDR